MEEIVNSNHSENNNRTPLRSSPRLTRPTFLPRELQPREERNMATNYLDKCVKTFSRIDPDLRRHSI